jgi:tetratricopeptide (TPR) repeat protein
VFDNDTFIIILVICGAALLLFLFKLLVVNYYHWRHPGMIELHLAREAVKKNEIMKSLLEVNLALKKDPKRWNQYLLRAALQYETGQFIEAEKDVATYLEHYPENEFTHSFRGKRLIEQEQFHAALAECEVALTKKEDYDLALNYKAAALIELARYDEAREIIPKVPLKMQEYLNVFLAGCENMSHEGYNEALGNFRRARILQPENHRLHVHRAHCFAMLAEIDNMRPELEHVLSKDPDSKSAKELWMVYLSESQQLNDALEMANLMVQTYPDDGHAWNMLGNVYLKQQNYEAAMQAHAMSHQKDPGHGVYMRCVGYCHAKLGDYQQAIEWTNLGLQHAAGYPQDHINLAHYHLCLGDITKAEEILQSELAKKPDLASAIAGLGWVDYVRGETCEADAAWQRAGELNPKIHDDHGEIRKSLEELKGRGVFEKVTSTG